MSTQEIWAGLAYRGTEVEPCEQICRRRLGNHSSSCSYFQEISRRKKNRAGMGSCSTRRRSLFSGLRHSCDKWNWTRYWAHPSNKRGKLLLLAGVLWPASVHRCMLLVYLFESLAWTSIWWKGNIPRHIDTFGLCLLYPHASHYVDHRPHLYDSCRRFAGTGNLRANMGCLLPDIYFIVDNGYLRYPHPWGSPTLPRERNRHIHNINHPGCLSYCSYRTVINQEFGKEDDMRYHQEYDQGSPCLNSRSGSQCTKLGKDCRWRVWKDHPECAQDATASTWCEGQRDKIHT